MALDRRRFIRTTATATAAWASGGLLSAAETVSKEQGEPALVDLLIGSDRERLPELLAARIRAGLTYSSLLGALAEAAVRTVQPYPVVGFKYHAFMVLQAIQLATVHGRPEDRWLPILWAADAFKGSQADERAAGGWALGPVPEHLVPPPARAESAFLEALERWDPEAADAALVGLLGTVPRERLFEHLFTYGARDFRDIGHKAITVANCHRLLSVVPPEHAEPLLRSVVLALQNHQGQPNPATADLAPDRPWRRNRHLATQTQGSTPGVGVAAGDAVPGILQALRDGSDGEAAAAVADSLGRGVTESAAWTAVFAAAGELMLQASGIISVHANTTANALYYASGQVADPATRQLLLLQAAAFLPLFRGMLRTARRPLAIDGMAASDTGIDPAGDPGAALAAIFAALGTDPVGSARQTLAYLQAGGPEAPFLALARRHTLERVTGYHDFKLSEAAFESAAHLPSPWRQRYLAANVPYLQGPADQPNEFVARARALLGSFRAGDD